MMSEEKNPKSASRIGSDSLFYNRVVPVMLVSMGVVMLVLIVVALGVLLGFVPFR
ncbi:MAG: hypothetical protein PVI81_00530 [Anaerolineales bacterium]|jgi:hypothetical protein